MACDGDAQCGPNVWHECGALVARPGLSSITAWTDFHHRPRPGPLLGGWVCGLLVATAILFSTSCGNGGPSADQTINCPPTPTNPQILAPQNPPPGFPAAAYFANGHYLEPCPALPPTAGRAANSSDGWQRAVVGADDATISIYFLGGDSTCGVGLRKLIIAYQVESVTVDVYLGQRPVSGQCNMDAELYTTTLKLGQPLAHRTLTPTTPLTPGQPAPAVEHQ